VFAVLNGYNSSGGSYAALDYLTGNVFWNLHLNFTAQPLLSQNGSMLVVQNASGVLSIEISRNGYQLKSYYPGLPLLFLDNGNLVIYGDYFIACINPSLPYTPNSTIWSRNISNTASQIMSAALTWNGKIIIDVIDPKSNSYPETMLLIALNAADGVDSWFNPYFEAGSRMNWLAVDGTNTIYFSTPNVLYCIDSEGGSNFAIPLVPSGPIALGLNGNLLMNQFIENSVYSEGALLSISDFVVSTIWIDSLSATSGYVHEANNIVVTGKFIAGQWPPVISCNFASRSSVYVSGYYIDSNHIRCSVPSWITTEPSHSKFTIIIYGFTQNYTSNAVNFEFKTVPPLKKETNRVAVAFGVIGIIALFAVVGYVAFRYVTTRKKSDYAVIQ